MPDRTPGRQQEVARSDASSTPALSPTERLFARTDANLDGEFRGIFGAGGPEARAALEHAASTEGRAAYARFQADPDAFGTVIGNRERAHIVGGASDALAYSKAVHAADQAGRTPSAPGSPVQTEDQVPDEAPAPARDREADVPVAMAAGPDRHLEPSVGPEPVRYELPELGPWVSTDPSNRLGSPYVTTDSAPSVDASGTSGATGRFFDGNGRPVGNDGSTDDRRYLVNDAGAAFLGKNEGVGSVADIREAGGAVYEIRGTYASYEFIDTTFARRGRERQESHAALSISATGADVVTDFGTVTASRGDGYNVGRTYTPSDFVRIGNRAEAGAGAEVVFVAHDHPPDRTMESRRMEMNTLMNNPTGYVHGQSSEPPNDYSAIGSIDRMARDVAVRGSDRVYGVLFSRESDGLVFYDAGGKERQVSTTMRAIRSILNQ